MQATRFTIGSQHWTLSIAAAEWTQLPTPLAPNWHLSIEHRMPSLHCASLWHPIPPQCPPQIGNRPLGRRIQRCARERVH